MSQGRWGVILKACATFRDPLRFLYGYGVLHEDRQTLTLRNGKRVSLTPRDRDLLAWFLHARCRMDVSAEGEIVLRYGGMSLLLRPGTSDFYVFREVFLQDTYQVSSMRLRQGGTVIDVGAHVGYFSCAMLHAGQRVIAVEPVEENYRQAAKNIALNNGARAHLLRAAVVGKDGGGTVTVYLDASDKGRSSVADVVVKEAAGREEVEGVTLGLLLEQHALPSVDLVKMDVEGAEYGILADTPPAVLKRIRALVMELHVNSRWPLGCADALIERLRVCGFEVSCGLDRELAARAGDYVTTLRAVQNV